MATYDFTVCKLCGSGRARSTYTLPRAGVVYVCRGCGLHYLDHLDDLGTLTDASHTDDAARRHGEYIEAVLESNRERFESKVAVIRRHVALNASRCLDLGAGGGVFMSLLEAEGAEVRGIEPDPLNRRFAQERYGLASRAELIEDAYWQDGFAASFDVVTLWDVLEHVNFPKETLSAARRLLRPGGLLALDTPARDAFLYRTGEWSYRLTGGRAAALLATQYSRQPFGHKQIFSSSGLCELLETVGFHPVSVDKQHELSFPYRVYLAKLLGSARLARVTEPLAAMFFRVLPVHNKMVVVARKRADSRS